MNRSEQILQLVEDVMVSQDDALVLLGLVTDDLGDQAKIKKAYRKTSLKYHPDVQGGSNDMMLKVQAAYNKLKSGRKGSVGVKMDWEALHKKYREIGARILSELKVAFVPNIFVLYFNKISGLDFQYTILKEFPSPEQRDPSYAGMSVEFFTADRSTVFDLRFSAYLTDVAHPSASLGHADIKYPLSITAYGYFNKRKQKLSQRDWKSTNDHKALRDPKQIFPEAKLKKIFSGKTSKRKFKKRDMFLGLASELKANHDGKEWARIPIGDGKEDYKLTITRMVFMKEAMWMGNGIYKKMGRVHMLSGTFPESEETLDILKGIQKKLSKISGDKVVSMAVKLYNNAYENYKKKVGV